MKMNYRLDSSFTFTRPVKPRQPRSLLILLVVAVILVAVGHYIFGWFEPLSAAVARPFLKAGTAAVSMSDTAFSTRGGLVAEVERLRTENDILKARMTLLEERSLDLDRLRTLHGVTAGNPEALVVRAISKPYQTPYDVVVVDAGHDTSPNIKVGARAVAAGSVIIGQVVEVGARSSKIRLFSSSGFELPVTIGAKSLPAVAKGVGGGNFQVSLPRGAEVATGDSIEASAFPQYILGQVDHIDADPNDPFQTVRFRLPINFFELRWIELYD
jgi:cell shape-determining protein MreC